jgi:hypothetical protein
MTSSLPAFHFTASRRTIPPVQESFLNLSGDAPPCAMKAGFEGREAQTEHCRGLRPRHSANIAEHDGMLVYGGETSESLPKNSRALSLPAHFLWAGTWVEESSRNGSFITSGEMLVKRAEGTRGQSPQMHPGSIFDDAVQPRGKLGAALKLSDFLKSTEESLLQDIFGVGRIAHEMSRRVREPGHAGSEEFAQLGLIHCGRQCCRALGL